jgi:hypothetical protein
MRKPHVNPPGIPCGSTKICSKCLEEKPLTEFYPDKVNKSGYRSHCKECVKQYDRDKYASEGSLVRNGPRLAARSALKRRLVEQAGGKCVRCGYSEFISGLDFHHALGKKEAEISDMLLKAISRDGNRLDAVFKEAQKCVLLCRNCHSALHAREWTMEIDSQPEMEE